MTNPAIKVLLLRFEAALMSFGATLTDQRGTTEAHPGLSLVTGLLGNALGYSHSDTSKLQRLQDRLRLAVREDWPGHRLQDYQTVDLGQDFMLRSWTTRGVSATRAGGPASKGTHIRFRDYLADAQYTLAISLETTTEEPTLAQLEQALNVPARPLFLGRKTCLPSRPLVLELVEAKSLLNALEQAPLAKRLHHQPKEVPVKLRAWCEAGVTEGSTHSESMEFPSYDLRDWSNQVHTGRRLLREVYLLPPTVPGP